MSEKIVREPRIVDREHLTLGVHSISKDSEAVGVRNDGDDLGKRYSKAGFGASEVQILLRDHQASTVYRVERRGFDRMPSERTHSVVDSTRDPKAHTMRSADIGTMNLLR